MTNQTTSTTFSTWWICGLLLCASTINYMDRQTLSSASPRIKAEFKLSNEQYGNIELAFGMAFGIGATFFGIIADRTNVRWVYPIVLLLWSMMGFLTGWVETFQGLLYCRMFLGLFESGHWPCALKTTSRLLPPESRTLGNSVLQSGTAIGAIVTPLIMGLLLTKAEGSWRPAFQIIAGVGVFWIFAWVYSTNSAQLAPIPKPKTASGDTVDDGDHLFSAVFSRKFLLLIIIVIAINTAFHMYRVWMPLFLQTGRGFKEQSMLYFIAAFNIMTDVGCLCAGFLTRWLHQRGFSVHASRCTVFGLCATLVAAGGLIPWLPSGPVLMIVLLVVGLGVLGLFPCYYSFSQELSTRHQGKITGLLGTCAWLTTSPLHRTMGRWADETQSYDLGMSLVSLLPLVALFVLVFFWPEKKPETEYTSAALVA